MNYLIKNRNNTSKILAIVICIGGASVMVGWVLDISILKSIVPNMVTMKFTTALCFFLSGLIVFFSNDILEKKEDISHIVLNSTVLTILLMMFTLLLAQFFDVKTGIEELFVQESNKAIFTSTPGRPSIGTMSSFILIATVGILSLRQKKQPLKIIRIIGIALVGLGGLALIGYLVASPKLYYSMGDLSSAMAVHTAVLFVFTGLGFILIDKH